MHRWIVCGWIVLALGCRRSEPPPAVPATAASPAPATTTAAAPAPTTTATPSTASQVIDGFTGRTSIEAGQRAKATARRAADTRSKDLKEAESMVE